MTCDTCGRPLNEINCVTSDAVRLTGPVSPRAILIHLAVSAPGGRDVYVCATDGSIWRNPCFTARVNPKDTHRVSWRAVAPGRK